ncbi:MAG: esterase-like activity of phytase family protein, partial [Devosia sp.]|nr:esterase-like activity of phytase family protein [Devosia sp.]
MLVDRDFRMIAVGDTGSWFQAQLVMQDDRLVGIRDLDIAPLRDGSGQPLTRGWMADAESLARLPDGRLVVGFERWHRIRAYARPGAAAEFFPAPPGA